MCIEADFFGDEGIFKDINTKVRKSRPKKSPKKKKKRDESLRRHGMERTLKGVVYMKGSKVREYAIETNGKEMQTQNANNSFYS